MFPVIKNFRETNIVRAFIMSSILFGFVSATTYEIRLFLNKEQDMIKIFNVKINDFPEYFKFLISFILATIISIFFYLLYHFLFAYGGGMLAKYNCHLNKCTLPAGTLYVGKNPWDQIINSLKIIPRNIERVKSKVVKRVIEAKKSSN